MGLCRNPSDSEADKPWLREAGGGVLVNKVLLAHGPFIDKGTTE